MTTKERMLELIEEQRSKMKKTDHGEEIPDDILPLSDEFTLACFIVESLSTKGNPAVFSDGNVWQYGDDGVWHLYPRGALLRSIAAFNGRRVFKEKVGNDILTKRCSVSMRTARAVADYVETILETPGFFSDDSKTVIFKNGGVVVSKEGAKVLGHSPEHRARDGYSFPYYEKPAPRWRGFLNDLFEYDDDKQQKIDFLQEFVGACLIRQAHEFAKCCVMLGSGGNGKSVLLDVLQRCFPTDTLTSIAPQQWEEEYYRALLVRSQVNVVSELPERDVVDSPAIKAILSGERVTARRPREEAFEFRPKCGHIFAANKLPTVPDSSRGFWRRMVVITFNRSFDNSERVRAKEELVNELVEEVQGIVYWGMQGAKRLMSRGSYTGVPSSVEATKEWRVGSDQVAQFVREKCDRVEVAYDGTPDTVLYQQFKKWAADTGHPRVCHFANFLNRVAAIGYGTVEHMGERRRLLIVRDGPPDPQRRTADIIPDA